MIKKQYNIIQGRKEELFNIKNQSQFKVIALDNSKKGAIVIEYSSAGKTVAIFAYRKNKPDVTIVCETDIVREAYSDLERITGVKLVEK